MNKAMLAVLVAFAAVAGRWTANPEDSNARQNWEEVSHGVPSPKLNHVDMNSTRADLLELFGQPTSGIGDIWRHPGVAIGDMTIWGTALDDGSLQLGDSQVQLLQR